MHTSLLYLLNASLFINIMFSSSNLLCCFVVRQVPQPSIDYLIDKVMERFQTRTEEDLEMQDTPIPSILDTSFDSELTPNPK